MNEISAGVIIYRRTPRGLKFLILYHGNGYWSYPKGKIESEEKGWEAAVREVREETGLRLSDLKFKKHFKTYEKFSFWRMKERVFKTVVFYLAETKRSQIIISDEHEGYGWFTYKEAMQIVSKYKDSQRILTQAYQFVRRGGRGGEQDQNSNQAARDAHKGDHKPQSHLHFRPKQVGAHPDKKQV